MSTYWYTSAVEQGDDYSQNALGVIYSQGIVVTKDYSATKKWFQASSLNGNKASVKALKLLKRLKHRLNPGVATHSRSRITSWSMPVFSSGIVNDNSRDIVFASL